ncbi:phosphonate C-P lyase system protein PhnG [Cucumibacter marinus]|uniref:phosphonate C-P lyase system protein PhnG n=1 Tax=Cucumibacter marinus TaxID=1121252 RepID=UPI00041E4B4F|nr:phosphonate C-P lyase system protein PhnG [Cucumibacter marinus]
MPTSAPSSAPSSNEQHADRQRVMRVLALSQAERLETLYEDFDAKPDWTFARRPETGLVMVRGRTGGGGAPFNLGEMTVTRAAVTLNSGETGHAYVQGGNQRKAAIAAFFDAAWQSAALTARVKAEIVDPLNAEIEAEDRRVRAETAATKVDFFTMVRGED